jgi:AraC-like DNA-binding protein
LVFWEDEGRRHAGVTGPETATAKAPVPDGARFVGIEFALGTSLHGVQARRLVNGGIVLPDTHRTTFRLDGGRFEIPAADDAELLAERLARVGVIVRDPVVSDALRGERGAVSDRTIERRFLATTGLTQGAVRQIERAREAAVRLAAGVPSVDVVMKLGYYDEPHLARALRRYVGRTAGQLREGAGGALGLDLGQAGQPTTS